MHESQLIKKTDLLKQRNGSYNKLEQTLLQVGSIIKELEALLPIIDLNTYELNELMTVIIGLSELLVFPVDPSSPLATDLAAIAKQTKLINDIITGTNRLPAIEKATGQ